ncbi:hypothetical protein Tco_0241828 [Tanacetum coccineum]
MGDESAKVIDCTREVANSYVVMSHAIDEPVVASRNNKGTEDGKVGHGVTLITTTPPSTSESSGKSVNFRTLIASVGNGDDVAIPLESVRAISERFANTAYGFFLGKRVAYPSVANHVGNT